VRGPAGEWGGTRGIVRISREGKNQEYRFWNEIKREEELRMYESDLGVEDSQKRLGGKGYSERK